MTENIQKNLIKELMLSSRFLRHYRGCPSTQENILKLLAEKKSLPQKEIQELLEVQPGSISEIISKLQMHGLVIKEKMEDDNRAISVSITEKGLEKVSELQAKNDEGLFSALSDDERQQLLVILTKLNNDWLRKIPVKHQHCHRRGNHHMNKPMDCRVSPIQTRTMHCHVSKGEMGCMHHHHHIHHDRHFGHCMPKANSKFPKF